MDLTWLAAFGFIALGVALGVLLEHWLLWWLLHRPLPRRGTGALPGRERKRGEPSGGGIPSSAAVPPVPPSSLGRYVQRGRVAVGSLQVPDLDTRVR